VWKDSLPLAQNPRANDRQACGIGKLAAPFTELLRVASPPLSGHARRFACALPVFGAHRRRRCRQEHADGGAPHRGSLRGCR
jgi:hypothetical protein